MNLNEPADISQPEDIRRKIDEREAVVRGTMWEQMGCPQSKLYMPIDEYMKTFKGRHWFVNKTVLAQAQQALRIVLCPKCYQEKHDYGIEATQFFVTVEDDVMTVFPAVGHFVCHWCGFEEYHPLKTDPRVRQFDADVEQRTRRFVNQAMPNTLGQAHALGSPVFGSAGMAGQQNQGLQAQVEQIQQAYAAGAIALPEASKAMAKIVEGIQPGMGPIYGITEDEQRALYRLWQRNKKDKPPTIVESREEAESLAKLPAIERRQYIIQKLRDLGKI